MNLGEALVVAALVSLVLSVALCRELPFRIDVVDESTGQGVPLACLETVHHITYVTDNRGVIALDEPELMGQEVYFHVRSHGYSLSADGFGYRGVRLAVQPGGQATVQLRRRNVAERLYRVTGAGLFRDSLRVGDEAPIGGPLLNAKVLGSDSVQTAVLDGRLLWFWGDTNRLSYPLGNFHTPGATSSLPDRGGLDPSLGVELRYFTDPETGFAAETARMPGDGPTWIGGLSVIRDLDGRDRLFCGYVKVRPPMTIYRRGIAEWNDSSHRWEHSADVPNGSPAYPDGHTFQRRVEGVDYVYFATPYPLVRVPATVEAFRDPSRYESFTCVESGGDLAQPKTVRDESHRPVFAWRRNAPPLGAEAQRKLVESGDLRENEVLLPLRDIETGEPVLAHGGSVAWNKHRERWLMIAVQAFGKPSFLGEVWYAEADSPLGPWVYARRVVTHDDYSFYNPKHHPYFDQENGRRIYFEGTYTQTFSGNGNPTPRYDYNQVMYRLDLDDPRLGMPVAIYREGDRLQTGPTLGEQARDREIAFFAPERASSGLVGFHQTRDRDGNPRIERSGLGDQAHFFAWDPGGPPVPHSPDIVPLWEWVSPDDHRVGYTVEDAPGPDSWKRRLEPVAFVWRNPGLSPHPLNR